MAICVCVCVFLLLPCIQHCCLLMTYYNSPPSSPDRVSDTALIQQYNHMYAVCIYTKYVFCSDATRLSIVLAIAYKIVQMPFLVNNRCYLQKLTMNTAISSSCNIHVYTGGSLPFTVQASALPSHINLTH